MFNQEFKLILISFSAAFIGLILIGILIWATKPTPYENCINSDKVPDKSLCKILAPQK